MTLSHHSAQSLHLLQEHAKNTVKKYGVGSCGPRGFYGTIDVHMILEQKIANFMGTEESIIYSYDLATVPSILPAFANAKDLLVCDEVQFVLPVTQCPLQLMLSPECT